MWILVHLVAIEWALAAAAVCLAWCWRPLHSWRGLLLCLSIPLAQAAAAVTLLVPSGYFALKPVDALLLAGMAGASVIVWTCYLYYEFAYRDFPLGRRGHVHWLRVGMIVQLASASVSSFFLSRWFTSLPAYQPLSANLLAWSIGLAIFSGAGLLAAALNGCRAGWANRDDDPGVNVFAAAALQRAVRWLETAVVLRALALGFSLWLGAQSNPIGPRFFFQRLLMLGSTLFFVRILLGLVLPLIFGLLALLALRSASRQEAVGQFVPTLIVALIGEILAAGLTVGMAGLAF